MSDVFESIKVYDDLVPEDFQNFFVKFFMQNTSVSWNFVNNLTRNDSDFSNPGLSALISSGDNVLISEAYFFLQYLIQILKQKTVLENSELLMTRAFLQLPNGMPSVIAEPHTDTNKEHVVVIYYVCDSDGDTHLINKTNKEITQNDINNEKYEVIKKVSPKKGRLLVFDGSIYHASSSPQYKPRCVINFNIKKC